MNEREKVKIAATSKMSLLCIYTLIFSSDRELWLQNKDLPNSNLKRVAAHQEGKHFFFIT